MRRHHNSLWTNTFLSIAFSSMAGILAGFLLIILFSAFIFFLMDDWRLIPWFSSVSAVAASFSGGYICGKFRRRRGLIEGLLCGAAIYAALCIPGTILNGHFPGIVKLLLLTVSGAAGGVCGVNSKRPSKLRD